MAAPTFVDGDVYQASFGSFDSTPAVGHQAHNSGDLVIQFLAHDENASTTTPPSTGINGETLLFTVVEGDAGNDPSVAMIAWVATSDVASPGTREWTVGGGAAWVSMSLVIPAGEFDSVTPIDSQSGIAGNGSNSSNVPTPAWTCIAAGGRVIVFLGIDADPILTTPTGWTLPSENTTETNVKAGLAYRNAETTALENIPSVNFTISNDTSSTVGLVVNGPAGGDTVIDVPVGPVW